MGLPVSFKLVLLGCGDTERTQKNEMNSGRAQLESPAWFSDLFGANSMNIKRSIAIFLQVSNLFFPQSTIGAAFLTQTVAVPPNDTEVKFEIWDTAGQERYRSLAPMYYRYPLFPTGAGGTIH